MSSIGPETFTVDSNSPATKPNSMPAAAGCLLMAGMSARPKRSRLRYTNRIAASSRMNGAVSDTISTRVPR